MTAAAGDRIPFPPTDRVEKLSSRLGICRSHAIGLISCIQHSASEYKWQGDIGAWSNDLIGIGVDWEGDCDELVDAYVEAGVLVRHKKFRLLIADWPKIAPEWTRRILKNKRLRFALGEPALLNQHLRIDDGTSKSRRRRRVAAAGGNPSKVMRREVLERDGHKCRSCSSTVDLTLDHIIAVSRGGKTTIANLQTLCRSCNSRKGAN